MEVYRLGNLHLTVHRVTAAMQVNTIKGKSCSELYVPAGTEDNHDKSQSGQLAHHKSHLEFKSQSLSSEPKRSIQRGNRAGQYEKKISSRKMCTKRALVHIAEFVLFTDHSELIFTARAQKKKKKVFSYV
jgi:hypothetical protein